MVNMKKMTSRSIVSLVPNPSSRVTAEQELPGLVVAEDQDGEGHGRQPPVDLQGVHPQALVHAGRVGEDGGEEGLEAETEVHEVVLHALLEHGVLPGLANDQVGPLHDDNGDEEGGVARVLEDLPVCVRPLLPVRVFKVVHSLRIPGPSQTQECGWPEAVFAHDDKVDEEASAGLDHTDLTVGHGDQTLVDKLVCERVPWLPLHDVALGKLVGHRDSGHHVRSQVDAENGDSSKGQGHVSQDEEEEGGDLGDVGGQGVGDGLLQVVEDQPALLNTSDNGGKVVIEQDHVGSLLGDVGAGDTHGNTDVGLLQGGRVVDTISG